MRFLLTDHREVITAIGHLSSCFFGWTLCDYLVLSDATTPTMSDESGESDNSASSTEISNLLHLIDQSHICSLPTKTTDLASHRVAALAKSSRNGIRLPAFPTVFPALSPHCSTGELAYPTPNAYDGVSSMRKHSATEVTDIIREQEALSTHLDAVRRGFAFHRNCNRYAFVAYDEGQAEELLVEFETSIANSQFIPETRLCEIFSIALIASVFNRVQIPAQIADVFYRAASGRIGEWMFIDSLAAMRCCALLGLSNVFQKATISLLYFGKCVI